MTTVLDNTLNPEDIAHLSELRSKIEQEVIPLWKKANIMMRMDVVIAFAEKMIALGNEYHIQVFIRYGEPLQKSTQTFKIAYIQRALEEFPVLVKPLMGDVNYELLILNVYVFFVFFCRGEPVCSPLLSDFSCPF